jgi:hypothetical protein
MPKLPPLHKSRKRGSIYQSTLEDEVLNQNPISNLTRHMFQNKSRHSRISSNHAGLLSVPIPQFGSGSYYGHGNTQGSEYYNGNLTSGPPPGFFEGGSYNFANQSQPLVVIGSKGANGLSIEERSKQKRKKRIARLKALRADASSRQYDKNAHFNDPMFQYMLQSQNMQQFHTNTMNMMMMGMMMAQKDEVQINLNHSVKNKVRRVKL